MLIIIVGSCLTLVEESRESCLGGRLPTSFISLIDSSK